MGHKLNLLLYGLVYEHKSNFFFFSSNFNLFFFLIEFGLYNLVNLKNEAKKFS